MPHRQVRRTRPIAFLALAGGLSFACGDNIKIDLPERIEASGVTVERSPLRLIVRGPTGSLEQEAFLEVAMVTERDAARYYDPNGDSSGLSWEIVGEPTSFDAARNAFGFELASGEKIAVGVQPGPVSLAATLTVDTSSTERAVLVRIVLPRDPAEAIFGFGETFDSAVASNVTREMQLRLDPESESGLNETHVPIPLALWPARNIGVFVDDPRPAVFDIGATRNDAVLATVSQTEPGAVSTHIFSADEPLELTRIYAQLTALPAVPPRWAFAPQQWRNQHNSSDEVRDDANQMRALGIPGSTMWIDNPWQTAYNSFEFDETRFGGVTTLLAELKALGYRVVVWSTPYVNRDGPTADEFDEAQSLEYLVKDISGRPFVFPWQNGPGSLVDFSRPGATAWWQERIARATVAGISGFKLDFGEDLVPELGGNLTPFVLAAGTAQTLHAAYSMLYHRAYFDALPVGDAFLITRAGSPGGQAVNPAIWPGDLSSDFSVHGAQSESGEKNVGGLPAAIAGGLSLSVSGYPFYGSDIGGFRDGPTTTEVLIRWAQYASLGTIMQLGGGGASHNPWDTTLFGPEALPIYRRYARLHMDLFPTLYTLALEAGRTGTPITIPTRFVYPQSASDDATFLFGETLFVAPVIEDGARNRRVVLPPGEWVDFWTGLLISGDGTTEIDVSAPLDTLPLWQRAGTVLALFTLAADTLEPATAAGVTSYADSAFGREITFRLAPTSSRSSRAIYDGATFRGEPTGLGYGLDMSAGNEFDIFTIELHPTSLGPNAISDPATVTSGGTALVNVLDNIALLACPADPGCYFRDTATGVVRLRTERSAVMIIGN